jgi:hypothetical protein
VARRLDPGQWFYYLGLRDGSDYLRWSNLFDFLVSSDGRRIACRALDGASREIFQTYLLGQVLSFALIKLGIEPLHSTAAVIGGRAIGFLGDCGAGKSSLAAAFLQAGSPLLTDDLLVLKEVSDGLAAYPGMPRIKLFPEVANRLLGEAPGTLPDSRLVKMAIRLDGDRFHTHPAPLNVLYRLRPVPRRTRRPQISIINLSRRAACLELLRSTYNPVVVEPQRLEQQFAWAARLATRIRVKSLAYPRDLSALPHIRQRILEDLAGGPS